MQKYDATKEDRQEGYLTDEFVRRIINETIEFDRKIHDPEFLRKVRIEEEEIRNIDLEAFLARNENLEEDV